MTNVLVLSCNQFLFCACQHSSDNLWKAIVQEFVYDFLTKVNAKECAPKLKQQGVIPEKIETRIDRSEDAEAAREILYNHLFNECTLKQIEKLADVMAGIDRGFGTTKEVGRQLQKRLQGYAHKRKSPTSNANSQIQKQNLTIDSPSASSSSASSCSLSKFQILVIILIVVLAVKLLPICLLPWPFTNIWQHQGCQGKWTLLTYSRYVYVYSQCHAV